LPTGRRTTIVNTFSQHILDVEPSIDLLQAGEASHQQTRAREQYERQRHLGDHEGVAQAAAARALAPCAFAAFLERVVQVQPRRLECRRKAEGNAGQKRNRQRPGEHR
jgi:hypothetical protein